MYQTLNLSAIAKARSFRNFLKKLENGPIKSVTPTTLKKQWWELNQQPHAHPAYTLPLDYVQDVASVTNTTFYSNHVTWRVTEEKWRSAGGPTATTIKNWEI